jgi:hypothetical protein
MNLNLTNLVAIARSKGGTSTTIVSSWRAERCEGETVVDIYHYATLMLSVHDDGKVTPISRGWGSMSDKKGLRKILTNVTGQGYADVYEGFGE